MSFPDRLHEISCPVGHIFGPVLWRVGIAAIWARTGGLLVSCALGSRSIETPCLEVRAALGSGDDGGIELIATLLLARLFLR